MYDQRRAQEPRQLFAQLYRIALHHYIEVEILDGEHHIADNSSDDKGCVAPRIRCCAYALQELHYILRQESLHLFGKVHNQLSQNLKLVMFAP